MSIGRTRSWDALHELEGERASPSCQIGSNTSLVSFTMRAIHLATMMLRYLTKSAPAITRARCKWLLTPCPRCHPANTWVHVSLHVVADSYLKSMHVCRVAWYEGERASSNGSWLLPTLHVVDDSSLKSMNACRVVGERASPSCQIRSNTSSVSFTMWVMQLAKNIIFVFAAFDRYLRSISFFLLISIIARTVLIAFRMICFICH